MLLKCITHLTNKIAWKFQVDILLKQDFIGRSEFYKPALGAILQIGLWDIDLKFSRFSDVNIDNPAKFCEVIMSKSCISRKQEF